VELEELVDLRAPSALGGLVDRHLDAPAAVRHDLGHERRVLRGDRLVGEVAHLGHAKDALVEAHPLVHAPELDVADDVVQADEQVVLGPRAVPRDGRVAREEGAVVGLARHERVDGVAEGGDARERDGAVLVALAARRCDAARPATDRLVVGVRRVGHRQGDDLDGVAMASLVRGDG
jgi:hypothetical protein